ncbi:MAG TPA: flagellar hook-associated protein FlgL [Polyangiales bacterium]|nr:flagellar hook-associated protein FlgL [Polyangiales bacterium]
MRVADSTFYANMKANLGVRRDALAKAQEQALSGMRVTKPSDDPLAFTGARKQTSEQARAASYERATNQAVPSLEVSDSTLADVENVMRRIRDMTIQGANDTLNGNDRAQMVSELDGLKQQLVTLANAKTGDRFIFGGYKDNAPPYDPAGVYSGATETQSVEVARNVMLPVGITGDRIFGDANGGTDIFQTITDLQTALTSGVADDISGMLDPLDVSLEQVRVARSELGHHLNAADISLGMAQRQQDEAVSARSKLVEIDAVDAYSELMRAQSALSAAIEIAAQLPPPGLVERAR